MRLQQLLEQLDLLLESKKTELIAKKQAKKILAAHQRDRSNDHRLDDLIFGNTPVVHHSDADMMFDTAFLIISFFQAKIHKKYVQWIANRYMNREFQLEDWKQVRDDLKQFDRVKNKLRIKDINQYDSMVMLDNTIDALGDKDVRSNRQKDKDERKELFKSGDATLFYKDSDIKIEIPKTEEAACILGKGTRWCTSSRDNNMFHHYDNSGDLYIITTKSGEKYQFHMDTKQFMDDADREVNMVELLEEYPSILKAIPELKDNLSLFDRIHISDMSYHESYDAIKDWITSSTNFRMDGDTIVVETFGDLGVFFRTYNFDDLHQMVKYFYDYSDIKTAMDLDQKVLGKDIDLNIYLSRDIIDNIHDHLIDLDVPVIKQLDLFNPNKGTYVGDIIQLLKRYYPALHHEIALDIVDNITKYSVDAMKDYIKKGIDGDSHEYGIMGFLFDTESSHSYGFLYTYSARTPNFWENDYALGLEVQEIVDYLDAGHESMDDHELKNDIEIFLGEEFMQNDNLKAPEEFYMTQDFNDLEKRINRTLASGVGALDA